MYMFYIYVYLNQYVYSLLPVKINIKHMRVLIITPLLQACDSFKCLSSCKVILNNV